MATYYADKANQIQLGGGNVETWDTAGRIRVAYDECTMGAGNIPSLVELGDDIVFGGAGIPPYSRITGALIRWGDIKSGISAAWGTVNIGATPDTPEIYMGALNAADQTSFILVMKDPDSKYLTPLSGEVGNAARVGSSFVFPSIRVAFRWFDDEADGQISLSVFYVLD